MIAGADRGKQGRVVAVDPSAGKLRVEKVRMQKRHLKAGRKGARTGGVIDQEGYSESMPNSVSISWISRGVSIGSRKR